MDLQHQPMEAQPVRQERMDRLIAEFPDRLQSGEDAVVAWLADFARLNDQMDIACNRLALAEQLLNAGYSSESSGDERITFDKHGPAAFRRRLIEFALFFLESDKPVPAGASRYADYYLARTGG
ncbi:MAG: hypothetical protein KC777_13665 [Cyanobacteria bacterium HKST-UBA02]|nr:hypothetical protein [Cyanobacteria bacterium HKST-UBA02]